MYFLLLIGFSIGNLACAFALRDADRLGRVLAVFHALATLLTLSILVAERGGPTLPDSVGFWIYPLTQPLARALTGAWLWRHADEGRTLTRARPAAPAVGPATGSRRRRPARRTPSACR